MIGIPSKICEMITRYNLYSISIININWLDLISYRSMEFDIVGMEINSNRSELIVSDFIGIGWDLSRYCNDRYD
ncbi:unnamed protein product [Schistosoma rodhaini]|uniref:Uncharacterized protein n=2 Tax=Schistosoma rodhaini TaxID=6188 RepID=A0AA85F642_9TREM|nr:unnamed protein product [Schistosoma rodhaini]CAH8476798.1 unnamed protein product [Schistosoma rodhaini]